MSILVILVLRLIHIFAGVFWAGAGFAMVLFVEPTTHDLGPTGGQFMRQLNGPRNFSPAMGLAGLLSTLSGLLLYWNASGFRMGWITSGEGIALTIGGVAGIAAMMLGLTVHRRLGVDMAALGQKVSAGQGPPDPALLAEIGQISERLRQAGRISSVLLIVALVTMSIAEYL